MPRLYAILEKPKNALNSKVKILSEFVKHLSHEMCCKPASFRSPLPHRVASTFKVAVNQVL